jgi:glutaminase
MPATAFAAALPIQTYLEALHARFAGLNDGEVATYIPELAKADPRWFGICVATTDGRAYEVGDTRQAFTIQSISKPFVYGLALEDHGRDVVLAKIGVEPTGDAFNSISLEPGTGRPLNPMINAGAIAAASLVAGHSNDDRFYRVLSTFSLYAGRALALDQSVYESERDTGHRNRAIAHMLRNFDILTDRPEGPLDVYFRQCSIAVDCHALAVMAATLANGGLNPLTGERAVRSDCVGDMLSVMATCGMYDYAGEWVYWVGMPAKSGVGGGILAVLPGQLGIAIFSPPLDARGNSVRGVAVCKELSRELNLHFLRTPRPSRATVRGQYDLAAVRSKRVRSAAERELLHRIGTRTRVYELQGDLTFSGIETVTWRVIEGSTDLDCTLLDFSRVTDVDDAAARVLLDLVTTLAGRATPVALVHGARHSRVLRFLAEHLTGERQAWLRSFPDLDAALEWCEERVLTAHGSSNGTTTIRLAEHQLCQGLDADGLAHLEGLLERRRFAAGTLIVRRGDPATELYLLTGGKVSVTIDLPQGQRQRVATLSAGMTFGELAILSDAVRSADVRVDEAADCYTLAVDAFRELARTRPDVKLVLLENLLRTASQTATRLTQEIAALASVEPTPSGRGRPA